jgi:hypothetical protein
MWCTRRDSNPHLPDTKSGPFVLASAMTTTNKIYSNGIVPWSLPL